MPSKRMAGFDPGMLAIAGPIGGILVFSSARRRRAPTGLAVASGINTFCGLENVLLAGAHLTAVVARALAGKGSGNAPFAYDFRFYSLLLTGFVIVIPGFLCLISVKGLLRGEKAAWQRALWSSLALLAVNVPLLPIQGFAYALAAVALINLIALRLSHRRFPS